MGSSNTFKNSDLIQGSAVVCSGKQVGERECFKGALLQVQAAANPVHIYISLPFLKPLEAKLRFHYSLRFQIYPYGKYKAFMTYF